MSSTLLYFLFIISIGYGVILANKINNNYINCIDIWDWNNNQLLHDIHLSATCPSLYSISSCTVNINGSNHNSYSLNTFSPSFKISSNSCILTLDNINNVNNNNIALNAHCCTQNKINHVTTQKDNTHSYSTGYHNQCYNMLKEHSDNNNNDQINCHTQNEYTDLISSTQFYRNTEDNFKYVHSILFLSLF